MPHGRREARKRTVPAERILKHGTRLNLTEEQVTKLEELAHDAKARLIDLRADMAKERLELQRLRQSDSEDIAQFKKHFNAMSKLRVEVQEIRLMNRIEAKKVLTDEQKRLLKEKSPRRGMIRG
jgi:Spy/CpxP family protein refolding chaperone